MSSVDLLSRQLAQGGQKAVLPAVATMNSQQAAQSSGLFSRLRALAQWAWDGTTPAEQWFGPGQPLEPVAPEDVAGRLYDFPMTYNLSWHPRAGLGLTPFEELYILADTHDITRLCIETRKDQLARQKWTIRSKQAPGGKKFGPEIPDMVDFFRKPDQCENYLQWQGRLMEDMLVGDCATLYQRLALDGSVYGFEPMDGTTIKPLASPWGRVPTTGSAYVQELKGLPAIHYTRDQLIYAPRRPRNKKGGYGLSFVEQIIVTVNICLRRQFHQLSWYTDGAAPDLIIGVPKDWSVKEITKLKAYWEAHFRGNSKEKRGHPLILAGGNECKFENTKKDPLKDEFDEWLARVVCYCFSLPPTPFIKSMNRATAQTAQETALSEGLAPLMTWWKGVMDDLVARKGRPDAEFAWIEEEAIDPLVRSQVHDTYLQRGVLTVNEVRDDLGKDPIPGGDVPFMTPPPTVPPGTPGAPQPAPDPAATGPGGAGNEQPGAGQKLAKAQAAIIHRNHDAILTALAQALGKSKAKKALPSRNREDLLKMEAVYAQKAAQALNKVRKDVVARVKASAHKLSKDSGQPLANIVTDDDFKKFKAMAQAQSVDLFQAGVSAAGRAIDANDAMLKLANGHAITWAEAHAGELVTQVTQTTKDGVRDLVDQALLEGWSNADLADKLEDAWEFGIDRAALIATTETAMADLAGNAEICREAGVEILEWLTAEADACDQCADLDGDQAPINGEFKDGTKADDVAHPCCRCDRIAVLPDQTED